MVLLNDGQLNLGSQSPNELASNNKIYHTIAKTRDLVRKERIKDDYYVELYEDIQGIYCYSYILERYSKDDIQILGQLNSYSRSYPYNAVELSYVLTGYQGRGYSKILYRTMIDYLGGLVSDNTLTGDKSIGSYHTWKSLSKYYNSYLIPDDECSNDIKEVGIFTKKMCKSAETRFMVSIDEVLSYSC
jgi:hypothetical protein